MNDKKVEIIKDKPKFNKKIGNAKFNQIFDNNIESKIEKVVEEKKDDYKKSIQEAFENLKIIFSRIDKNQVPKKEDVTEIYDLAFQLKGKGTVGGYPLVTEIAKSLYEFQPIWINLSGIQFFLNFNNKCLFPSSSNR
jgi:hypothetical protein